MKRHVHEVRNTDRVEKAKFRVGQVVMIKALSQPFKIYCRYFDGLPEEAIYENADGDKRFESSLRPLTKREKED